MANSAAESKYPKPILPETKSIEKNNEPKQEEIPIIREIVENLKRSSTRNLEEGIKQLYEVLTKHPGIIKTRISFINFFRS